MKTSIIVPGYNEEKTIAENLLTLNRELAGMGESYEIIVVSDGSTDTTAAKADSLGLPQIQVLSHPKKQGKGKALLTGFQKSRGDIVVFMDADLVPAPDQLPVFIGKLVEEKAAAVIGSKRLPGATVKRGLIRKAGTWIYNFLARTFFKINFTDTQGGFKVFQRGALEKVVERAKSNGFAFDLEILAELAKRGEKIIELPLKASRHRPSRIRLRDIATLASETLDVYRKFKT